MYLCTVEKIEIETAENGVAERRSMAVQARALDGCLKLALVPATCDSRDKLA